jgi:carbamoyltransferase
MKILGLFHSYADPSAAVVVDGRTIAFAEEERFLRNKHANGWFPSRSVRFVLQQAGLKLSDLDLITQAWNCPAYDSGEAAAVYAAVNLKYPTNAGDLAYQKKHLDSLTTGSQSAIITRNLRQIFGDVQFPPVQFMPHHLSHAAMALRDSGFDNSLVLTIDGSGDWNTTCWWLAVDGQLQKLHEVNIPHSLGWFYSAMTEYLGFQAYDGEYKVMGLAAYGQPDAEIRRRLQRVIWYDGHGGFETDPMLLSRGTRRFSYYYPDTLTVLLGQPPRPDVQPISDWHMSVAFEVQQQLEEIVLQMTSYWVERTGVRRLAIAGGVGLNIKMNSRLFESGLLEDLFIHPLCSDTGVSIGGAMAAEFAGRPIAGDRLQQVSLGPEYSDTQIENILQACKLSYHRDDQIEQSVARLIADGRVVGWFQGRMEGGPRALGNRSILGDPRVAETRDRVNAIIKFREPWRPFCPSMTAAGADRYLKHWTHAPFMIIAFPATELARQEIPAVVHVDGTARVQVVQPDQNPRYHRLLQEFETLTGVPCLLNTSFNVKGEPIVCTPQDAVRTFAATGLDALAIGNCLLTKTVGL